ncbi:MAG: hypothetical protein ACRD1L_03880 [Terriglobales bacterium]
MNPAGMLSRDTSAAIERRQIERWREMTPAEKLELVGALRDATLAFALAGIRQRHPAADERECHLRLRALTLGPELARKVYPELAQLDD